MSEDSRHWIQGPHDARCDLRYEVSMEVNPYSLHKQSNFRFDTGNSPAALNRGARSITMTQIALPRHDPRSRTAPESVSANR